MRKFIENRVHHSRSCCWWNNCVWINFVLLFNDCFQHSLDLSFIGFPHCFSFTDKSSIICSWVSIIHFNISHCLCSVIIVICICHFSSEPPISCVSININHKFLIQLNCRCNIETRWINICPLFFAGTKWENSDILISIQISSHFIGVKWWIVADDTTINIKLIMAIAVFDLFWVEESWCTGWWFASLSNLDVVNIWVDIVVIFTVESWLLGIVFVWNHHKLFCCNIREICIWEFLLHQSVKIFSSVLTCCQVIEECWNIYSENDS